MDPTHPSAAPLLVVLSVCSAPLLATAPPATEAPDDPPADEESEAEAPTQVEAQIEGQAEGQPQAEAEAESEPATLLSDEIVVSAERVPIPKAEVGSSVTVIDRQEIELRNETSVLELFRTVPGLEVVQGGGPGRLASVFLRGASSEHTLVLIDGIRVNPASGGGFDFANLTTDNLERIEILRGPQSTLYGSEAMGGVVSLITRRGAGSDEATADLRAGSFDTERLALTAAGGRERLDYSVGLSGYRTDGVSAASERRGNTEDDPYENLTASGRLGWRLAEAARADLTLRYSDAETGLDGFSVATGPVDDPNFLQDHRLAQAALALEGEIAPGWRAAARVGTAREDTEGTDPDTPFNNYSFDSRLETAGVQTDLELGSLGRTTAGYDFERRRASQAGAFDEEADLHSVFLLHRWSLRERLHLTAGARYDEYSESPGETTWRLTASWLAPGVDGRLHGSFGTGFRVPSFTELFFPGAGNPDLVPESSEGWDLGWEQGFLGDRAAFDVTVFRNRFDDLIVFDLSTGAFANVAEAESEGVETVLTVRPSEAIEMTAAWTWNDTDDGTGRPLARRPENRGSLGLVYAPEAGWRGMLSLAAVADRIDSDGAPIDDYERLDLSLEAPPWGRWRPYLRIDNLLDEDYEEVPGFTTPGFAGHLGLRVKL